MPFSSATVQNKLLNKGGAYSGNPVSLKGDHLSALNKSSLKSTDYFSAID